METEKSPFGGMKLFFIAYFALLMLALTFIGVMGWLDYELVTPSAKFVLFGLLAPLVGEGYLADIAIIYVVLSFIAVMMLCRIYIDLYDRRRKEKQHDQ